MNQKRKVFIFFLACIIALLVMESISWITIQVMQSATGLEVRSTKDIFHEQTKIIRELLTSNIQIQFDSELGWRYSSNLKSDTDRINSQGLRSDKKYDIIADSSVLRVAAFGDSFIYCNEVANENSWPALTEVLYKDIDILNYGVGGYGTDQAYLRFKREGLKLSPDLVIIGFAPVNIRRVVNVYRRFISDREIPLVKPRFNFDHNGELTLIPSPFKNVSDYDLYLKEPDHITKLGENDQWYNPIIYENPFYDYSFTVRLFSWLGSKVYNKYINTDRLYNNNIFNELSSAFKIQVALIDKFAHDVVASGRAVVVVVFPDRYSILDSGQGQMSIYEPLLTQLSNKGIDYLDLTNAFLERDPANHIDDWFMPGGHYSPMGNKIVASWLGKQLLQKYRK